MAQSVILYDQTRTEVDINNQPGTLGKDVSVTEFPEGILNVTTVGNLTAREVANAIRTFLNDSDIVKVEYVPGDNKAVITYKDDSTVTYAVNRVSGATEAEVAGAELVAKIQNLIGQTSTTGVEVAIVGNTIVTKPGDDTASTAYKTPDADGTAPATKDLVAFLVKLHENDARSIEYKGVTYEWNSGIRYQCKWLRTGASLNGNVPQNGNDTLITAVAGALDTKIQAATTGTVRVSETIIVDGAKMNIAIDYVAS